MPAPPKPDLSPGFGRSKTDVRLERKTVGGCKVATKQNRQPETGWR
jgi:hypothetical protein